MHKLLGAALLCGALTGCAGMNSDFDCNKTATDQCLSMSDASRLAAKHKSLDDLSTEKGNSPKPVAEALATPGNQKPAVNPNRPVSVTTLTPRPAAGQSPSPSLLHSSAVVARPVVVPNGSITPASYSGPGHIDATRVPDATQRLWIAPWVDEQDNFHQPAVVEFVKNKSHWDDGFRVIGEGE